MKYPRRGQNVTDSDRCWNCPCFNYDRDNSKPYGVASCSKFDKKVKWTRYFQLKTFVCEDA